MKRYWLIDYIDLWIDLLIDLLVDNCSNELAGCGETVFSGLNGILTSPNYPFPYPHNMSCKYSIDVGRNSSALLKLKVFDLERPDSADICKDWLMVCLIKLSIVSSTVDTAMSQQYCAIRNSARKAAQNIIFVVAGLLVV